MTEREDLGSYNEADGSVTSLTKENLTNVGRNDFIFFSSVKFLASVLSMDMVF